MALPVYESEFEDELEGELEDELEYELEGEAEDEYEDEFELEGEYEDEDEGEYEDEDEGEYEYEISPVRKIYSDAMMEHLGALAAESESEEEAVEHFLPLIGMAASKLLPMAAKALAPMARRALPKMVKAVTRVAPHLTRGVGKIARKLYSQPGTRRLVRTVPSIARRTVHSIARQASHGRPVTGRTAMRTLARQTRRVLKNPRVRHHTMRRNHHMDRRFHHRWGRGHITPHGRRGRHYRHPHHLRHGYAGTSHAMHPHHTAGGGAAVHPSGHHVARPAGCPSCGTSSGAAPSYCRCCGQVLR